MAGADTLMKMMATYKLIGDQKENLKKQKDKVAGALGMGSATARADRLRGKIKKKADDKKRKEDKIAATARDEAFLRMHSDGWQAALDSIRGFKAGATEQEETEATATNDKMVSDAEKAQKSKRKKTGGRQKGTPNKVKMNAPAGDDGSPSPTAEGNNPISGVINGDSMSVTSPALQELLEIETAELELDERREMREIKAERRALEDRRDKKGGALLGKVKSSPTLMKEGKGFMSMLGSVLAGPFGRIALAIGGVSTGLTLLKTVLNKIPGVNMKIDPKDAEKLKVKEAEKARLKQAKIDEAKAKAAKIEADAKAKAAALEKQRLADEAKARKVTANKIEAERVKAEKLRIADAEAKSKALKLEQEAKAKLAAQAEAEAKVKKATAARLEAERVKAQKLAIADAEAKAKAVRLQEAEIKRNLKLEKAAKLELKVKAEAAAQAKLDAKNAKLISDQKAKLQLESKKISTPKLNSVPQKIPGATPLLSQNAQQLATKGVTPARTLLPNLSGTRLANSSLGKATSDMTGKAVSALANKTPDIVKTTATTALKGAATVATKLAVPLTVLATAYEGFKTEDDDTLNRDEKNAKHVGTAGAVSMALAGAAVGSVVPVVGTLLGGLAGGAIGYFMGKYGGEKLGEELFLDGKEIGDPSLEKSASEGGKGGETKAEMDMVLAKQAQNAGAVDIGWGDADIDDLEKLKDLTTEQVQALLDVETWSKADEEMLKKVLDAKKNGLTITHDDGGWFGKESLEFGKPGAPTVNKEKEKVNNNPHNLQATSFSAMKLAQNDKETYDKFREYRKAQEMKHREGFKAAGKGDNRGTRRRSEMRANQDAIKMFSAEILQAGAGKFVDKTTGQSVTAEMLEGRIADKKLQDESANAMLTEGSIFTHDTHLEKILNGEGDKDSIFNGKKNFTVQSVSSPSMKPRENLDKAKDLKGADTSVNANQLESALVTRAMQDDKNANRTASQMTNVVNQPNNSVTNTNVHQAGSTAHAPQTPAGIGHMGVGSRG